MAPKWAIYSLIFYSENILTVKVITEQFSKNQIHAHRTKHLRTNIIFRGKNYR